MNRANMDSGQSKCLLANIFLMYVTIFVFQKKKNKNKAETYNFSALHLIHDPQGNKAFRDYKLLSRLRLSSLGSLNSFQ